MCIHRAADMVWGGLTEAGTEHSFTGVEHISRYVSACEVTALHLCNRTPVSVALLRTYRVSLGYR